MISTDHSTVKGRDEQMSETEREKNRGEWDRGVGGRKNYSRDIEEGRKENLYKCTNGSAEIEAQGTGWIKHIKINFKFRQ